LVGERHSIRAIDREPAFADHVDQLDAARTALAARNDLKSGIGLNPTAPI
jgi:hypothetical protein